MSRPHRSARLAVCCLAVLCSMDGTLAHAQTVRYGVLAEDVRTALERAWSDRPIQAGRAYCVRRARLSARRVSPGAVDSIIQILAIRPADAREADPHHADPACPPGTPELHVRIPAPCPADKPGRCANSRPAVYSCQPSRGDYEKLLGRGDPFGIVQCARRTFRFYYPSDFARTSPARPAAPPESREGGAAPRPLRRSVVRPR